MLSRALSFAQALLRSIGTNISIEYLLCEIRVIYVNITTFMHNSVSKEYYYPHPHISVDYTKKIDKERRDYDSRKLQYFSFQDSC